MIPRRTAGRPKGTGRGERILRSTRVAPVLDQLIEKDAIEMNLPMSDVVGNIIAAHYGHPELVVPPKPDLLDQGRLAM